MVRIATRGSTLAVWQAERVASLLRARDADLEVELVIVETQADQRLDVPIWELGGKGVFAKEVQAAVLDGRADIAVHSAKDLTSTTLPGLCLAAVPERGDPRDALVGATLRELPKGAEVATGSVRRQAQLAAVRPDLRFVGLRGNMQTRLAKAADHAAIVVAATALDRLGREHEIAERLEPSVMLPQVAQGALAVECREDDEAVLAQLAAIEDRDVRRCVDAERAFLTELGGDCSLPAAAYATLVDGHVLVRGLVAAVDGSTVLRHEAADGAEVARHLLDSGGSQLLGRGHP